MDKTLTELRHAVRLAAVDFQSIAEESAEIVLNNKEISFPHLIAEYSHTAKKYRAALQTLLAYLKTQEHARGCRRDESSQREGERLNTDVLRMIESLYAICQARAEAACAYTDLVKGRTRATWQPVA